MSLAILYSCLPVSTFASQLWTAVAASALQSFVSQLWTSQTLVAECSDIEKHKLFGVYGGVISSSTVHIYHLCTLCQQRLKNPRRGRPRPVCFGHSLIGSFLRSCPPLLVMFLRTTRKTFTKILERTTRKTTFARTAVNAKGDTSARILWVGAVFTRRKPSFP